MHAGSVAVICQSPKQTTSALNGADRAVFCGESGANHVANTVAPLCLHTHTDKAPSGLRKPHISARLRRANRWQIVHRLCNTTCDANDGATHWHIPCTCVTNA